MNLGGVTENISFFEKQHWYINEITEKIDYAKLKASYYASIGEKKKALDCISGIPEDWLYEEEIIEFHVIKAMMLWGMGAFSTACELVSDEKYNGEPMVWMLRSLVVENSGDLNKAFEYVLKAKSICESGKVDVTDKIQIYCNFGRIQLMRGNRSEAVKYFNDAYHIIKNNPPIRVELLHIVMQNLVMNKAIVERDHSSVEKILDEYKQLIEKESISNFIEYQNCLIGYYRQTGKIEKVYRCIKDGYFDLVGKLDDNAKVLFQASTFRMLMNGRFVHDWFDKEVEKSYQSYNELPLQTKLMVYREYSGILQQEESRSLLFQSPYKELDKQIMQYYRQVAIVEINEAMEKLDPREIYKYNGFMQDKLAILKLLERENHIENSKTLYMELYKMLNDAGLRIDATHVLMILVDECASASNIMVQLNPFMPPVTYLDFIEKSPEPPAPQVLTNGIQLNYYHLAFPNHIRIIPRYEGIISDNLAIIMEEVRKWQNHPAKWEQSVHIAHLLMCLNRRSEAEEFYGYFKDSKMSIEQYAAWFQDECRLLEAEFYAHE